MSRSVLVFVAALVVVAAVHGGVADGGGAIAFLHDDEAFDLTVDASGDTDDLSVHEGSQTRSPTVLRTTGDQSLAGSTADAPALPDGSARAPTALDADEPDPSPPLPSNATNHSDAGSPPVENATDAPPVETDGEMGTLPADPDDATETPSTDSGENETDAPPAPEPSASDDTQSSDGSADADGSTEPEQTPDSGDSTPDDSPVATTDSSADGSDGPAADSSPETEPDDGSSADADSSEGVGSEVPPSP